MTDKTKAAKVQRNGKSDKRRGKRDNRAKAATLDRLTDTERQRLPRVRSW